MSFAAIVKISMAEKNAKEIINKAKEEARRIIENARMRAREIEQEEHVERLVNDLIEKYRKKIEHEISAKSLEYDEEFERLTSISDEELDEIVNMLVEVILSG